MINGTGIPLPSYGTGARFGTSSIAIPDTSDAEKRHNNTHDDTRIKRLLYNNIT